MKDSNREHSNVIQIPFSKALEYQAPLDQDEWGEVIRNLEQNLSSFEEVLDSHHFPLASDNLVQTPDLKASFLESTDGIISKINQQISYLKKSSKRIKYYLDELDR